MQSLNAAVRAETDGQMVVVPAAELAQFGRLLALMADTDYRTAEQIAVAKDMLRRVALDLIQWAERPE